MPLKRATPSFTVEYRQVKRSSSGSAKSGWAHAKPAGLDEKANRIAISAFKAVAAKPPADVISPTLPTGRVLPSLVVETAPVSGQDYAEGTRSKSRGSAAKAGHAAQVQGDGTGARHFGEPAYPDHDLEPSIAVDTSLRLKRPTTSDLSVEKAGTLRSEKRTRRPAEKQEKLDSARRTNPDRSETAPQ
jgi:hypothetical protein